MTDILIHHPRADDIAAAREAIEHEIAYFDEQIQELQETARRGGRQAGRQAFRHESDGRRLRCRHRKDRRPAR